jgi:hypothetical protein
MNRRIAQLESREIELPTGYEVRQVGFQRWELVFGAEIIGEFSSRRYALNAAQRDSLQRSN